MEKFEYDLASFKIGSQCKTRAYCFTTDTLKCYLLCSPFLKGIFQCPLFIKAA